jgi:hypothetical protein
MANFDDIILFGEKSLSDIFKQIHKNNKDTDKQINELIDTLKPLASSNAGSAVMLMPTVKDLIDVNVKNNEQLIKMAGIVQRASSNNSDDKFDLFNSPEIQKLLEEQKEIKDEGQKLIETTSNIQLQIDNK